MYLLKDPQIKVNIVNSDGNTALHYLCKSFLSPSCLEIAALMLQLGVDINRPNNVCYVFPSLPQKFLSDGC